jgi:uncharacterized protein YeaO (DUF488 family)
MVQLKRAYRQASPRDGIRVLVDRLWPRGLKKAEARIDEWCRDLAPSTSLRKWFGHDPAKWTEFRRQYRAELNRPDRRDALHRLSQLSRRKTVTLVYGSADEEHNQAVVLKELLEELA